MLPIYSLLAADSSRTTFVLPGFFRFGISISFGAFGTWRSGAKNDLGLLGDFGFERRRVAGAAAAAAAAAAVPAAQEEIFCAVCQEAAEKTVRLCA